MKPKVFAIIVNWNGEQDTVKCLESLCALDYDNLHVIVSDNGSRASSISALVEWFRATLDCGTRSHSIRSHRIIENKCNLGFTGANSTGISTALREGADYILFLNNDTIVTPSFLDRMVNAAEGDGGIGVVGCKIYFAEPESDSSRRRIWSLGGYRFQCGMPLNLAYKALDRPEWTGIRVQELINGCCMLIRRQVIKDIGVQDDRLFFGIDDVEYSHRAARFGWKNVVVRDAVIFHSASRSVSARAALQIYYLFRNVLYFRRHAFPWYRNLGFGAVFAARYVIAPCVYRWLVGRAHVNRGVFLAIQDYWTGTMGECKHAEILAPRKP